MKDSQTNIIRRTRNRQCHQSDNLTELTWVDDRRTVVVSWMFNLFAMIHDSCRVVYVFCLLILITVMKSTSIKTKSQAVARIADPYCLTADYRM